MLVEGHGQGPAVPVQHNKIHFVKRSKSVHIILDHTGVVGWGGGDHDSTDKTLKKTRSSLAYDGVSSVIVYTCMYLSET